MNATDVNGHLIPIKPGFTVWIVLIRFVRHQLQVQHSHWHRTCKQNFIIELYNINRNPWRLRLCVLKAEGARPKHFERPYSVLPTCVNPLKMYLLDTHWYRHTSILFISYIKYFYIKYLNVAILCWFGLLVTGQHLRTRLDLKRPKCTDNQENRLITDVRKRIWPSQRKQIFHYRGKEGELVLVKDYRFVKPTWFIGTVLSKIGNTLYLVKLKDTNFNLQRLANQLLK